MSGKIVPMLHVPDVRATSAWYPGIGFALTGSNEEKGVMNWALLRFGDGEVTLNSDGKPSSAWRREVDLYVHAHGVDALLARLADRAEIVEEPHDTLCGMRGFIVRDCDRFWITVGESAAGDRP